MDNLITTLKKDFPKIEFKPADKFYWSSLDSTIYFDKAKGNQENSKWALLHELGHARLGHNSYIQDYQLLRMEVMAWEEAKIIAKKLELIIEDSHIQDCLDSYRDWLYRRSLCPSCKLVCSQNEDNAYECMNCQTKWTVSKSKFCRPYRSIRTA